MIGNNLQPPRHRSNIAGLLLEQRKRKEKRKESSELSVL
jgi:hypothetical protein